MGGFVSHLSQDHVGDVPWNGESVAEATAGVRPRRRRREESKAVTYSEIALEGTDKGWRVCVVFDP